jgi:tetratricopeptide (TPR) repeat protein
MKKLLFVVLASWLTWGTVWGQASGAAVPADPSAEAKPTPAEPRTPDQAEAYYHYSLGHIYEELAKLYSRSEYANQAIEEYKLAIQNDPASEYLSGALAELYAEVGRIRDAVEEAQKIIQRDPSNIAARQLLGRIYLRSLGDQQTGPQSSEILKRAIEQYEAIVKLDPNGVENRLLLGRLYRSNNQSDKAEEQFKTALQLQPLSEDAATMLAYLYNEQGDPERAAKLLDAIPEAERSGHLYLALGYTYEQEKDYKRAIDAYRKAVDADPENMDAVRGLGQNLMNDGQTDAALQQFQTIVDADPQDAQSYMRMAEIYRRSGKFDQALEVLKKVQSYAQDSLEVGYNLAIVYEAQGRFQDAIDSLQPLLSNTEKADGNYGPGDRQSRAPILERLGTIYRDSGKYDLAVSTFRKMLDLGDDSASLGYQEIVDTYREAKMWPQASAAANEGVAKLPEDRGMKLTRASLMADDGHGDQAIADAKALLKNTPDDREVYISLAQIAARLKRFKESEEYIAKAEQLATKPEQKQYVWFVRGSIQERQKKYDDAEEMFKKVLDGDGKNTLALNYLGYMLADRGVRLQEALGYIKRAVELEPQNGAFLDSLGWAYFKLGDYNSAEDNLRHASERMGSDPTVQDHLAELYAKTGRLQLAAFHWERAIVEWNKSVPADVDQNDFQRVQKKLESARVKLAKQQGDHKSAEAAKP